MKVARGSVVLTNLLLLTSATAASAQDYPVPGGTMVTIHVSPGGNDAGDGSAARPYRTLVRAQTAVRAQNGAAPVTVLLSDGTWRLDAPLTFAVRDGGRERRAVSWQAAPGARPVISGGLPVTGWRLYDRTRDIWVADVPKGRDTRQIWVNGALAQRAIRQIAYSDVNITPAGLTFKSPALAALAELPDQQRMEIEASGFWTYRYATIASIGRDGIVMQQPGWRNNLIGFDVIGKSFAKEKAKLFVANALAFVDSPGEWYLDPKGGRLYYRPRPGEDMASTEVILPRVEALVAIGGTPDKPVTDLNFSGITFAHASWLGPSSAEGYADQQTGAYLKGEIANYPADPLKDCAFGCPAFEAVRHAWSFMPAAVQVAAARRVTFERNIFEHLGTNALGIGNEAEANLSGVGLATSLITVSRNQFRDLGAAAVAIGGIRADAHHPPTPELGNRLITVADNVITEFGKAYQDSAGILATYVHGVTIVHNEVAGGPYDGIDVGWGWGMWDKGGNPRSLRFGTYDTPGQPIYDTPTILADTVVAWNRVHDVKRVFQDGGAIYHLSADPGALIAWNHVYDIKGQIGLYLDEASRFVTLKENVVADAGAWLNANTVNERPFERITIDNLAIGNWHRGGKVWGQWTPLQNNRIEDDHPVTDAWPKEAQAVIDMAGPRREENPNTQ